MTKTTVALVAAGINSVVMVDDDWDPRTVDRVGGYEAILIFYDAVSGDEDDEASAKLDEICGTSIADADALNDEHIAHLQAAYETNSLGKIQSYWKDLIAEYLLRIKKWEDLETRLIERGLKVSRRGSDWDVEAESGQHQIILMDYYLDGVAVGDKGAKAHRMAKRAVDAHNALPDGEAKHPIFVLMSSQEAVGRNTEEFLRKTELLRGQFFFLPKSHLDDPVLLDLYLFAIARTARPARLLGKMLDDIESGMESAKSKFLAKLRELAVSDYARLENDCLKKDGEPLGDYLFELFSTYLGKQTFENGLRGAQKELEKIDFDAPAQAQQGQTDALKEMIASRIWIDPDPEDGTLPTHPRDKRPVDQRPLFLQMGDVFLVTDGENERLIAVLSASCDLMFSPGGKRASTSIANVLLVPGVQAPLDKGATHGGDVTEIFKNPQTGDFVKIRWDIKNIFTLNYHCLPQLWAQNVQHVGRLRERYAIALQQAYAHDLTRAGLPAEPSLETTAQAWFWQDGEREALEPDRGEAVLVRVKEKNKQELRLSLELVANIRMKLQADGINDTDKWIELLSYVNMPSEEQKPKPYPSHSIIIVRTEAKAKDRQEDVIILLNPPEAEDPPS